MGQATLWWEISRLRVSIEYKTFTLIPTCSPARNDNRGGQHLCHSVSSSNACTQPAASVISTGAGQPPIRPERSEVEKSRSEMVQPPWRQEISRLRVLIEPKTFTLIPACSPARNDSSRDAAPAPFCFFRDACTQATAPVISTGAKRSGEISLRDGTLHDDGRFLDSEYQ